MGILTGGTTKSAGGLLLLGQNKTVKKPKDYPDDFPQGLILTEVVNGADMVEDQIQLVGRFAPHIPFEFGGEMKLAKEYYPGNSEPTVQVLGARESNTTIKGRLKTNKFKTDNQGVLREAAVEYQMAIDSMRLRGNLIRATLGQWKRYGFIEKVSFKLNTNQNIEFEIDFFIVGFNPPTLDKNTRGDGKVIEPNRELISIAAAALESMTNYPDSMPLSFQDELNGYISEAAEKINLVTNFISGITNDVDSVLKSANRALGLLKNARATISKMKRNVGGIATTISNLGGAYTSEWQKTSNSILNIQHVHSINRDFTSLASFLASLQATFSKLSQTVPMIRHLVKANDTLQKLSIKYYHNADNWNKIYTHNKLRTTELVVGTVLEIPKL